MRNSNNMLCRRRRNNSGTEHDLKRLFKLSKDTARQCNNDFTRKKQNICYISGTSGS